MKKLFLMLCLLTSCASQGDMKEKDKVFYIPLSDLQGNPFYLSSQLNKKINVVIFLSPDCPICQGYALTLRNLFDAYKDKSISFTGIIPGTYFTAASIENYLKTYQLPFNLVLDREKELVKFLKATVTPQCFVIDQNGEILYSGKIDDYAVAPGITKQTVTQHYLDDALKSILAGKKIATTKTQAAGCFIEAH